MLQGEKPKNMLVTVMPEEKTLILRDLSHSGPHYVNYIREMTAWISMKKGTYRLPSSKAFGFKRPSFSLAKNSSQGAILKEYGPEYIIGRSSSFST